METKNISIIVNVKRVVNVSEGIDFQTGSSFVLSVNTNLKNTCFVYVGLFVLYI